MGLTEWVSVSMTSLGCGRVWPFPHSAQDITCLVDKAFTWSLRSRAGTEQGNGSELSLERSLMTFGDHLHYYRPSEMVGFLAVGPGG